MTHSQGESEFTLLEEVTALDEPKHLKMFMTGITGSHDDPHL